MRYPRVAPRPPSISGKNSGNDSGNDSGNNLITNPRGIAATQIQENSRLTPNNSHPQPPSHSSPGKNSGNISGKNSGNISGNISRDAHHRHRPRRAHPSPAHREGKTARATPGARSAAPRRETDCRAQRVAAGRDGGHPATPATIPATPPATIRHPPRSTAPSLKGRGQGVR